MSIESVRALGIIGRLKIEGCKSFDEKELDRCLEKTVAPDCCKAHLMRAIDSGYTYENYLNDAGL